MESLPKKVHIIGPSGTGKTTLAEKMATLIGAEAIKLDARRRQSYRGAKTSRKS